MFDRYGNLPPGLHDWTFVQSKELLVDAFPNSDSRARIWSGYMRLCKELLSIIEESEHWLDGSFVTEKTDPSDLDLLIIVDANWYENLWKRKRESFARLVAEKSTRTTYDCDSYMLLRFSEHDPGFGTYRKELRFWKQWFGIDREKHAKGVVRLRLDADGLSKVAQ